MNAEIAITEAEIATVVDRFYAKVRVDPEIGPVFNDAVQRSFDCEWLAPRPAHRIHTTERSHP
jgi:hypothetical protein